MRFRRFKFRIALSLGLSMLCMTSVPVFADGVSAPTLSASANGSIVSLSWNRPGGTTEYMIRRSTTSAPTTTSEGDLVATLDDAILSYEETLPNGTYYYSIFATNGAVYSAAGSAGPVIVSASKGTSTTLKMMRALNGLNNRGYPISSSSSSLVSSSTSSSIDNSSSSIISSSKSSTASSKTQQTAAPVDSRQSRICGRVLKRFGENKVGLESVNKRLRKALGFTC